MRAVKWFADMWVERPDKVGDGSWAEWEGGRGGWDKGVVSIDSASPDQC